MTHMLPVITVSTARSDDERRRYFFTFHFGAPHAPQPDCHGADDALPGERGNVPHPLATRRNTQARHFRADHLGRVAGFRGGQGYPDTPGIYSAAQYRWRRVTDTVHVAGGRIFVQLWHVGRMSHPSFQPTANSRLRPRRSRRRAWPVPPTALLPFVAPRALDRPRSPAWSMTLARRAPSPERRTSTASSSTAPMAI